MCLHAKSSINSHCAALPDLELSSLPVVEVELSVCHSFLSAPVYSTVMSNIVAFMLKHDPVEDG